LIEQYLGKALKKGIDKKIKEKLRKTILGMI
jgi:hypothetical protein